MGVHEVRLPRIQEHIPTDGKIPNGLGLYVRAHYEGDPVGTVVGWDDQGDGTAVATVQLEDDFDQGELAFGLDAAVQGHWGGEEEVVTHIAHLKGIGVWPATEKPPTLITPPDPEP